MFDFTTETIINSADQFATVDAGVDAGVEAGKKALWVKRVNKFTAQGTIDTVKGNVVYKRAATTAVLAESRVTIPTLVVGTQYRIGVDVTTSGYQDGMFARNAITYGKPFYVEYLAKVTTAATAAEALAKAWNKTYGSYDNFITASTSGAVLIFTSKNNTFITFKNIVLESLSPLSNDTVDLGLTVTVTAAGKAAFGDSLYLMQNNRLMTMDNYRPFGLNQEELPTVGSSYNQYTFQYKAERPLLGQSAVGGSAESVTTHVFWVRTDLVGAVDPDGAGAGVGTGWEGALEYVGLTIEDVG